MLKIKEGEPWVMWPNNLVDNFIDFPANKIFDYDGNFDFKMVFEFETPIRKKCALFSKLPNYVGVDLVEHGFTFIFTDETNNSEYIYTDYKWEINTKYHLHVKKRKNVISLYINGSLIFNEFITKKLASDDVSHIIFGAGNFPKNDFNLNYFSVILHSVEITKEKDLISKHDFEKFINNKSFDVTNNCNFIYKI